MDLQPFCAEKKLQRYKVASANLETKVTKKISSGISDRINLYNTCKTRLLRHKKDKLLLQFIH